MKTYRYILSLNDASPSIVTPLVDDAQVYEYEREADEVFIRKKLAGRELVFCNDDYDIINNAAFGTKFTINKALLNSGGIYETDFIGVFYKTDCSFDADAKQVTVQPEPLDSYKAVIEGLDREFNLIDLAPATIELDYQLQPLFQVYRQGSSVVTNILSGNFFEQAVTNMPTGASELLSTYFFGYLGSHGVVLGAGEGLDPDVSGEYIDDFGVLISGASQGWVRKSDGAYKVKFEDYTDPDSDMIIIEVSSGAILYRGTHTDGQDYDTVEFVSATSGDTTKFIYRAWWGRFLTNQETIGVATTSDIPEADIVTTQGTYSKVIGIGSVGATGTAGTSYEDVIIASDGASTAATQWGKFDSAALFHPSEYFTRPTGAGTGAIYPLDRGNWSEASFWWQYDSVLRAFQEDGAETKTQFNAYKLTDVIQAVLTALGTGLTFAENTTCSKFLNDETNTIRGGIGATPVIVPKSNIIAGEYATPAKKAPVKLSDLLNLLWGFHKCKWHIDGTNFVVEHIQYYHNGQSYSGPNVGTDLTTLTEPKTGKSWAYKANKWTYDKAKIPGQIRFSWMDNGSDPFDGFPIEIRSEYADGATIEEITIGLFTADIDLIQLAPENVSKDGFFFGEAVLSGGRYTIPFVDLDLGNTGEYKVQNGYAALIYAHDKYHKYVMPATDVTINLEDVTAISVKRTKIQEIELPGDVIDDDNTMDLITTNLGSGLLRSATVNTNGSGSKLEIEHDL